MRLKNAFPGEGMNCSQVPGAATIFVYMKEMDIESLIGDL